MYNNNGDFYGNGNYGPSQNGGGCGPQNDYRGYNPYGGMPPKSGGGRKKGGKGWLYALLAVLAAAVVSALSIGIYAAAVNTPEKDTIKWNEPESQKPEPSAVTEPAENNQNADGNVSGRYSLIPSDTSEGDLTPKQVSEKVIPSVVCIQNYQKVVYESQMYGFGGRGGMSQPITEDIRLSSQGSGIIITEDGYIATNAHVVSDADMLKVILTTDEVYEARIVGVDDETDVAVLKIEATGLTKAEIGDSDDLAVGEYVMVIGNPDGLRFSSSVTLGIASAINRPLQLKSDGYTMNMIQTDAAINPGNSGGALVNLKGQVVGISSAKYAASGFEGLGFAITINDALPVIKDLMDYGKVQNRSMLGINGLMLDKVSAEYYNLPEGFYVYSVSNPNAGDLQSGDVILKINDTEVTSEVNMKNILKGLSPGTTVRLEIYRSSDNQNHTVSLSLVEYNTGG